MIRITLKGRIPSKKNSKIRTWRYIVSSKEYKKREDKNVLLLRTQVKPLRLNSELFITYQIRFPDARKTDLSNKVESINDMLVRYWLLEDDNWRIIKRMSVESMWVDKDNPRAEIQIQFLDSVP